MADERIDAIRQRLKHTKSDEAEKQSDRGRHTVYLSKTLMRAIDQAFNDAGHDLYPQKFDKADYLETCLKFALTHQDEIKRLLASHR